MNKKAYLAVADNPRRYKFTDCADTIWPEAKFVGPIWITSQKHLDDLVAIAKSDSSDVTVEIAM